MDQKKIGEGGGIASLASHINTPLVNAVHLIYAYIYEILFNVYIHTVHLHVYVTQNEWQKKKEKHFAIFCCCQKPVIAQ